MKTFLIVILLPTLALAQGREDGWSLLSMVQYDYKLDKEKNRHVTIPVFSKPLLDREGSEFTLVGYYMPFEMPKANQLIISYSPFSSCFFCGGGGPETVVEVELKTGKIPDLDADEIIKVKGKLKLNRDDWNRLLYIIEEAEIFDN